MVLLVEKYRPKVIKDIIGLDKNKIALDETLPHLFLFGPPGTGKTTLAKVIINALKSNYIILNSSDERGINTVREKVKAFASSQSTDGNIKICVLDECDALTPEAQDSLRNIIETYSKNCRFILTANYPGKVIEPLKSRCLPIQFNKVEPIKIVERLKYICDSEKIPYDIEALKKIAERCNGDIRKSINKLEEFKSGVFIDFMPDQQELSKKILDLIKSKNFESARQLYLDSNPEPEEFLKDLHDIIWNSDESLKYKRNAILIIAENYKFMAFAAWKEIIVESTLLKLMEALDDN